MPVGDPSDLRWLPTHQTSDVFDWKIEFGHRDGKRRLQSKHAR